MNRFGGSESHLTSLHHLKQQLLCQGFRLHRANLLALATQASRDSEYLPCYPVGALVSLAINFNGEFVAEWWVSADVHAFIMDDKNQAGHGYGIADSSDVCSTPLWLSKQWHKRNLTMKPEVTGRLAAIAFNCHQKRP
ncbi:MAG: hypothetical protein HZB64_02340 [Rhodocyclales bacterium]|nr:hypothetical protein [Rhodocyclales bacterium]